MQKSGPVLPMVCTTTFQPDVEDDGTGLVFGVAIELADGETTGADLQADTDAATTGKNSSRVRVMTLTLARHSRPRSRE